MVGEKIDDPGPHRYICMAHNHHPAPGARRGTRPGQAQAEQGRWHGL